MPKGLRRMTEKDVLELQRLARRAGITIPEVAAHSVVVKLSRKEVSHICSMLSLHESIVICRSRKLEGKRERGVRCYTTDSYQKLRQHMKSLHKNGKLGKRS